MQVAFSLQGLESAEHSSISVVSQMLDDENNSHTLFNNTDTRWGGGGGGEGHGKCPY